MPSLAGLAKIEGLSLKDHTYAKSKMWSTKKLHIISDKISSLVIDLKRF